jgi:hypothetical protein
MQNLGCGTRQLDEEDATEAIECGGHPGAAVKYWSFGVFGVYGGICVAWAWKA